MTTVREAEQMILGRVRANVGRAVADMINCVVCTRVLGRNRQHDDTCSERCFRKLLDIQRRQA